MVLFLGERSPSGKMIITDVNLDGTKDIILDNNFAMDISTGELIDTGVDIPLYLEGSYINYDINHDGLEDLIPTGRIDRPSGSYWYPQDTNGTYSQIDIRPSGYIPVMGQSLIETNQNHLVSFVGYQSGVLYVVNQINNAFGSATPVNMLSRLSLICLLLLLLFVGKRYIAISAKNQSY